MASCTILISAAALICGCAPTVGGTRPDGGGPDATSAALGAGPVLSDAAEDRPEATLGVRRAWWSTERALSVVVTLDNPGDASLPMGSDAFALELGGASFDAVPSPDPAACLSDRTVAPGATGRCVLRFEPSGWPSFAPALRHRPSDAVASIAPCSDQTRDGLCPHDAICLGGACAPLCGPSRWDGACIEDDAICAQGECRRRCSPEDPDGACDEGRCVRGRCLSDCASIAWPDDACFACAWDAIELGYCDDGPDRCRDCIDCPGEPSGDPGRYRYPTTCDCLERASCDGCRDEATAFWRCLLARCPACGE